VRYCGAEALGFVSPVFNYACPCSPLGTRAFSVVARSAAGISRVTIERTMGAMAEAVEDRLNELQTKKIGKRYEPTKKGHSDLLAQPRS
jgi:hypothetical protein